MIGVISNVLFNTLSSNGKTGTIQGTENYANSHLGWYKQKLKGLYRNNAKGENL